jgi:hypothetical protein
MDFPVCSANNTCEMCLTDDDCLGQVTLFEACHTEWEDVNDEQVQVIGRCVQDTYNKGFQVYAVTTATLCLVFVIVALFLSVFAYVSPPDMA